MMRATARLILFVCMVATVLPACGPLPCPEVHVAAGTDLRVATSCGIGVSFEDREYLTDCTRIHPSRVGEPLEARAEANSFFGHARAFRAEGFDPNDLFLLKPTREGMERGVPSFCRSPNQWVVADSFDDFGELQKVLKQLRRPAR